MPPPLSGEKACRNGEASPRIIFDSLSISRPLLWIVQNFNCLDLRSKDEFRMIPGDETMGLCWQPLNPQEKYLKWAKKIIMNGT